MTYNLEIAGAKFIVEVESHGYRKRFYGINVTPAPDKPYGLWDRMGYIGSYMPGSHSCGFEFMDGRKFHAPARGPKTAAKLCLHEFIRTRPVEVK